MLYVTLHTWAIPLHTVQNSAAAKCAEHCIGLLSPTWGLHREMQRGGTTRQGTHSAARGRTHRILFRIARGLLSDRTAPALVYRGPARCTLGMQNRARVNPERQTRHRPGSPPAPPKVDNGFPKVDKGNSSGCTELQGYMISHTLVTLCKHGESQVIYGNP